MTTVGATADWAHAAFAAPLPAQVYASTQEVLLNDLTMAQLADGDLWHRLRSAFAGAPSTSHLKALLGGIRIHALAMDSNDEPSQAHLGAAVIPVLATAPPAVSGDDFLRAVAIGWQAGSSIGVGLLPRVLACGGRPSVLFGAIGATVTAGLLRALPPGQLAESIHLVSDMATGASATLVEGSDDWLVQLGRASHAGCLASDLARAGLRGARAPFEGAPGAALPPVGSDPSPDGRTWAIERATFKRYPACNILQTAVALACMAGADDGIPAENVDHVVVRLNDTDLAYPGILNAGPERPVAAMMSGAFCVAAGLVHGTLGHDHVLTPGRDPRVTDLARRVRLHPDPTIEPASARLEVRVRGEATARILVPRAALSAEFRDRLAALLPDEPTLRRRHAALAADIAGLRRAPVVPRSLGDALWGDVERSP